MTIEARTSRRSVKLADGVLVFFVYARNEEDSFLYLRWGQRCLRRRVWLPVRRGTFALL